MSVLARELVASGDVYNSGYRYVKKGVTDFQGK